MGCSTYDRFPANARKRERSPAARGTLLWAALTILLAVGAILTLDRGSIPIPPAGETGASAGQA